MEIEYEKLKKNFKDIHGKYLEKLDEVIKIRELLDEILTVKQAEQILLREQLDESQIPFLKLAIEKYHKENDNLEKQLDEKESENLSLNKQLDKISDLFDKTLAANQAEKMLLQEQLAANLAEKMLLQEQLEEQKKKYNDLADEYV